MNGRRLVLRGSALALAMLLSACSRRESSPYPATWPALEAATKQNRCGVIDGVFSDQGSAANSNEADLGIAAPSVSLSGLLVTGDEQARAYAREVHVISATSCDASADLLDPSDRSIPTHLVQAGTTAPTEFPKHHKARSTADAGALSTSNIHFKFLNAIDGSLVVQETIRQAEVEDLVIPTEELLVLWFRFPKIANTAG